MDSGNGMREVGIDKLFNMLNYTFAIIVMIAVLYPLLFVVSSSFSAPEALISGKVWLWPVGFSLEGYRAAFEYGAIWKGFANSVMYMTGGTVLNVALTIAAAYPLSRQDLVGGKIISFIFIFTIIFSGGMIPTYLVVQGAGLLDSRWSLILPTAVNVFNVIVMMSFFRSSVPKELLESAKMDGCGNFRYLLSVVIPLSGAVIAVISLFYAVDHWNKFFDALLYLSDRSKFPLQLVIRDILLLNSILVETQLDVSGETNRLFKYELLKYSTIIVASLPMLIIYPFIQKHFVKGVMIGSIKG